MHAKRKKDAAPISEPICKKCEMTYYNKDSLKDEADSTKSVAGDLTTLVLPTNDHLNLQAVGENIAGGP